MTMNAVFAQMAPLEQVEKNIKKRRYLKMISRMYAVKDEMSGFTYPIPITNDRDAKAWFQERMESTKLMRDNPGDFNLYYLGTFDTESGTFIQHPQKDIKLIQKGVERDEHSN